MAKAVFPGSFDPMTMGHVDILSRGAEIFDTVHLLILKNAAKTPLFTIEERLDLTQAVIKRLGLKNTTVHVYDGLTAEYCEKNEIKVLLRGLRNGNDLDYEKPIAVINRKLYKGLETMFLPSSPEFDFVSSSILKEMARYRREELELLVPQEFMAELYKRLPN